MSNVVNEIKYYRVSWLDSAGKPARIHKVSEYQLIKSIRVLTVCGHDLVKYRHTIQPTPTKRRGITAYCPVCYKDGGKDSEWLDFNKDKDKE